MRCEALFKKLKKGKFSYARDHQGLSNAPRAVTDREGSYRVRSICPRGEKLLNVVIKQRSI